PPETFLGHISPHSDQYSLAIVYQELLTGQRPFTGKNPRQLAIQHTQEEPEVRFLPEAERPIVARALAKEPTKRFPNCLSFVLALYNARKTEPITIQTGTGAEPKAKSSAESLDEIHFEQLAESPDKPLQEMTPEEAEEAEQTPLGITMQQPTTGALRPTLIIGVGNFGRRALMELRCRFLDRFGELNKIPLVQFLYVDSDREAIRNAERGSPEVACSTNEIYPLPLQPVSNYRKRMLEQLTEWLPREKLYAIPRSLQTQGSRALGRLAFADNHLRFMARLKRDVQKITHPDTLYQSVSKTGLALRDSRPRIYVIAAAGGGSSGMLVDLAYGIRRLLHQLRHPEAEVTGMLFCGAPQDPATPKTEQSNVFATLTEINHFTDPVIPFCAQYGTDGPQTKDNGPPFHQVYLLQLAHRSPESLRDAVAHLGSYLFHELTTPLGLRLDKYRKPVANLGSTPFRSFGTYAVWFPRGLLLREAARQACGRLLGEWQETGYPVAQAEVEAACARALADPELRFETLCSRIQEEVAAVFDSNLSGALTTLLSSLEEQSQQTVALDDPGNWARQALFRVQDWVGSGPTSENDSEWRKSRLGRALSTVIQKMAGDWQERLSVIAFQLMENPGWRIAAGEAGLNRFLQYCQEVIIAQNANLEQQLQRTRTAWEQLSQALDHCLVGPGGFSFFGNRSKRSLRVFMDHLAAFSRQRLVEEVVAAGLHFLTALQGRLNDGLNELTFCRQSLRHLQEHLEIQNEESIDPTETAAGLDTTSINSPPPSAESYWEAIRETQTARVVLPNGEEDLGRAAFDFLKALNQENWSQLDQILQDRVLNDLGGLHRICQTTRDLPKHLAPLLTAVAADFLGEVLPVTDVAQLESTATLAKNGEATSHMRAYYDRAAPLVAAKEEANQVAFLLAPASDAGKVFAEEAKQAVPKLELVRVPGQADLMFCREQGYLTQEDLQRIFRACRQAYEESTVVPVSSPHARFDIVDWVPLDP
ncbi:MAG TPA: tubulin-like doman-containing protein, partial [Gemmataceae bacterium]|nr:tubulin-like doman-containing protein [Gemmataceae bacterium]